MQDLKNRSTNRFFFVVMEVLFTHTVAYVINFGVVSLLAPACRGNELAALFTHVVFGLIADGAYRVLLRRKAVPV